MTKKIIHISLSALAIAFVIFLLAFTNKIYNNSKLADINIEIDYPANNGQANLLVTENDINKYVYLQFDSLVGKKIDSVNIEQIENKLAEHEYLQNAEVNIGISGILNIKAKQREAFLRIIEENGKSYLVDIESNIIPVRYGYPCRLLVCNGFIRTYSINHDKIKSKNILEDSLLQASKLKEIYEISLKIYNDDFLSSQISQIYIKENGEFELIPIVGNHLIELGKIENLEEKLFKLKAFYKSTIRKGGWSNYKSINLKYKDQVVCAKR